MICTVEGIIDKRAVAQVKKLGELYRLNAPSTF